jgi:hypothetical protein
MKKGSSAVELVKVEKYGDAGKRLYLPNGALYFGCRKCWKLTCESSNESRKYGFLFRHIAIERGVSVARAKKILIGELGGGF